MKKIILSAVLMFTTLMSAQEYKLIWEENFNDPTVNAKLWNIEENAKGGGNAEFQYYKAQNVSIEKHPSGESCLVLSALKGNYKCRPATSGRVNTEGKLSVKYGKIDIRVQIPKTVNGLWPAFWMLGDDFAKAVWPKCGEIDIIEMGNAKGIENNVQEYYYNGACHWGENFNDGKYPNLAMSATSDYSLQGGFHLFTIIWTPDAIQMFLDQDKYPAVKPYFVLTINGADVPDSPRRYFNKPFHFVANLAVGGFFTGLPSPSKKALFVSSRNKNFKKITALPQDGSPVKMYIDYIRVYQNGTPGEEFQIK